MCVVLRYFGFYSNPMIWYELEFKGKVEQNLPILGNYSYEVFGFWFECKSDKFWLRYKVETTDMYHFF